MDRVLPLQVILIAKLLIISPVYADTYSVKIGTESHVNLVDSKFLSFTIDPKYLFSSSGKYKTKECICMASSLAPAYIRIAGPSTAQTSFHNSTISIDAVKLLDDDTSHKKASFNEYQRAIERTDTGLSVSHEDWEKFVRWAKKTGFDLVFALNNEEKTGSGMWDPNTALRMLTVAGQADVGDIFWQLGYECNNQSIEEYLNDLETLRVITETFPLGQAGRWRVVGGDVTPCLAADSKSDFKDYVTLSDEMFDAVFLNGNSTSQELERMSDKDRLKLLRVLSKSSTPLWLAEGGGGGGGGARELERAADWMASLGHAARNGFAVHFRELIEEELYEPTLSFYMALLFKNLVGERVLNVDMEASEATMFAHCTSLRRRAVPGAVTLYGANMDGEPARFSVRLSKKEDGGDIMQFILGHDHSGNIIVNGRAMYYEGDIKPVVKRVRPYKTLLINLPPKSFGFWVLANTQVEACNDVDDKSEEDIQIIEAMPIESSEDSSIRVKRSIDESSIEFVELHNKTDLNRNPYLENNALNNIIDDINGDLFVIRSLFPFYQDSSEAKSKHSSKVKRQAYDYDTDNQSEIVKKPRRKSLKSRDRNHRNHDHSSLLGSSLISKLRNGLLSRKGNIGRSRLSKRNSKGIKSNYKTKKRNDNKEKYISTRKNEDVKVISEGEITNPDCDSLRKRKRRSIIQEDDQVEDIRKNNRIGKNKFIKYKDIDQNLDDVSEISTTENEIDDEVEDINPVKNILHKFNKLTLLPVEMTHEKEENHNLDDYNEDSSDGDEIVVKTKFLDDSAVINISEKSKTGFLRSTIEEVLSILAKLNKNLSKVWTALTFLE